MEREIGDIFEYFGTNLEVVKSDNCDDCYFNVMVVFQNV